MEDLLDEPAPFELLSMSSNFVCWIEDDMRELILDAVEKS